MKNNGFPLTTEIDVVITKGDKCKIERMTYGDAMNTKRYDGFRYQYFEVGFHSFKQNI